MSPDASPSNDPALRYARNILIPGIGDSGQAALRAASVLIVGLGGLGSPAALYLAAAGVGTLGLLDDDRVELSNLQRQVVHATSRLGWSKVESAAETLRDLNPDVELVVHPERLDGANVDEIIGRYDAIVEASDSFETKYLLNDRCLARGKPLATAGILALSGQALFIVPGYGPCLRCLAPEAPRGVPTTAQQGVLGAIPGILGAVEALEVMRWFTGVWRPESDGRGLLHTVDGNAMRLRTLRVPRRAACACQNVESIPIPRRTDT